MNSIYNSSASITRYSEKDFISAFSCCTACESEWDDIVVEVNGSIRSSIPFHRDQMPEIEDINLSL
ncbi:hypothetical protein FA893_18200 [Photobacterium damselae subsp. piscicida]|uniref:Uncharacterized protein n=1 Tax=Photobacterium damsela subsp. piscicida TaxID=38294 RepID=A0AAD1CJ98_PHODP|nr:hypothetical protein [Photobacterium damselae]MDP2543368.1 hypothetical protein [Photobacterium damselae subsp. piscicida]OLQ78700.1 hypothetical protein BEI67_19045 [Photobacterium damselae subsp. piscicida]PSV55903.1 hypothetical protein CTT35_16325 [Photobacterium damselae]PSW75911.1 hypothetical protein CTT37_16930 [Photobacterium damselae]TFZ63953.1 hypothetical protein E4T25_01435 [Photobacterium damselae subsp. piscicida]